MDKKALRERLKKLREALSEKEWLEKSQIICHHLINSGFFKDSQKIAFYYYINKEVNLTWAMERALNEGKEVYLPKTHLKEKNLTFHRIFSLEELSSGVFGIPEPPLNNPVIDPKDLDLLLVPGLAFDIQRFRLGYGGGFYDKILKGTKALKIGIAFYFQIIERLPFDPWDEKVDYILTERGLI